MSNTVIFFLFFLVFHHVQGRQFNNPILSNHSFPGVIKVSNVYYMVATDLFPDENINIPIFSSKDLSNWKKVGEVFGQNDLPNWMNNSRRQFFSPEIHEVNGKFNVYFHTAYRIGEKNQIGVATASTPAGPYKDIGHPLFEDDGFNVGSPTIVRHGEFNNNYFVDR